VSPRNVKPGDPVTVSVVPNPKEFENDENVQVTEFQGPAAMGSIGGEIETPDGKRHSIKTPILAVIGGGAATALTLFLKDQPNQPATTINIPNTVPKTPATDVPPMTTSSLTSTMPKPTVGEVPPTTYTTPATLSKIQEIRGPLTGDATNMQATMDGAATPILASKPGAVYLQTSNTASASSLVAAPAPGPHTVALKTSPDANPISFTTNAVSVTAKTATTVVHPGQAIDTVFTVAGAQGLPGYTVNVTNNTPNTIQTKGEMQHSFDAKTLAASPVVTFTVHGVAKQQGQFGLSWTGTTPAKPVEGMPVTTAKAGPTSDQPSRSVVSLPEARVANLGSR